MLSCYFRALRLGGVLTSPQATPSGLQMTPPSLPGTENPGKHGSPDFILMVIGKTLCVPLINTLHFLSTSYVHSLHYLSHANEETVVRSK